MAFVSDDVLNEIRARVDIADLIGSRITLKRTGGTWKACCPFHKEKSPSFVVSSERQRYHCFGCGEDGDVFTFLMKHDGLTFMDAVRQLAERVGVPLAITSDSNDARRNKMYAIYEELALFYETAYTTLDSAQAARDYLAQRHLLPQVVRQFRLGYAPPEKDALLKWGHAHGYTPEDLIDAGLLLPPSREGSADYYDRFRGRLMFPICDHLGKVCAFSARILDNSHPAKYVNSPETLIFTKGRVLYALDKAREKIVRNSRREALICEGQIDVIRCHSAGFDMAVAAQGTAFTEQHVDLLKRYADSVILVFDADGAGAKAAIRTGMLLLAREIPVRVATLPAGEDPDSLILSKGKEAFQSCLDEARSLIAFQVTTLRAAEQRPDDIDSMRRISCAVIESLLVCTSATMRAHLLKEAASLLALPEEALLADLATAQQKAERKAALAGAFSSNTGGDADGAPADEQPPLTDDGWSPDEDDSPDEPIHALEIDKGAVVYACLLETLLHHPDNVTLRHLIIRYLPADIVKQSDARLLIDCIHAHPDNMGRLVLPSLSEYPSFAELVDKILCREDRLPHGSEMTAEDVVKDLIRKIWIIHFADERAQIKPDHPHYLALRTGLMKALKMISAETSWDVIEPYLSLNLMQVANIALPKATSLSKPSTEAAMEVPPSRADPEVEMPD